MQFPAPSPAFLRPPALPSIPADELRTALVAACRALNALLLEPYIPEDMQLQGNDKYAFLDRIRHLFHRLRRHHPSDWLVEEAPLQCLVCHHGQPLVGFAVYSRDRAELYDRFGFFAKTDEGGCIVDLKICNAIK